MKILFYEWAGIMQRDIKWALRAMGMEVKCVSFKLENNGKDEYFFENLKKILKNDSFDAVLSVHYFAVIADVCHEMGIPYISWIYDSPLVVLRPETLRYEEVFAFAFDRQMVKEWNQEGYPLIHETLAVNVERLDEMLANPEEQKPFACDCSFIGQLYGNRKDAQETHKMRVAAIQTLAELGTFHLYSKDKVDSERVEHKGTAMYYSEMPRIFRASRINLNVSLETIKTGIPLRVFDIMGAGGFLMTNPQEELLECCTPGVEFETFSTIEELREKARFYLGNETKRAQIALAGKEAMRRQFSFESQLKKILHRALVE